MSVVGHGWGFTNGINDTDIVGLDEMMFTMSLCCAPMMGWNDWCWLCLARIMDVVW